MCSTSYISHFVHVLKEYFVRYKVYVSPQVKSIFNVLQGGSRSRLESIDSRLGDDLLDDVLTAPSRAHNATPTNADEVCVYGDCNHLYSVCFLICTCVFLCTASWSQDRE